MEKFDGYLFSKLNAIGSKSEGPTYFLQQFDYKEYPVIKQVALWKKDPKLHKFLDRKVSIEGKMSYSGIEYQKIGLYKPAKALAAAKSLKVDLKLEHNVLWVDKSPGPKRPPQCTSLTLRVKWPYRSIWEGICPTTRIFDFSVEYKGKTIWTWSDDKLFAMVITPVTIPGGNWHEFKGIWRIAPEAIPSEGTYTARGVFVATGQEVSKDFKIKFAQ